MPHAILGTTAIRTPHIFETDDIRTPALHILLVGHCNPRHGSIKLRSGPGLGGMRIEVLTDLNRGVVYWG